MNLRREIFDEVALGNAPINVMPAGGGGGGGGGGGAGRGMGI